MSFSGDFRRGLRAPAAVAVALFLVSFAHSASAATFTVDSLGDTPDVAPGDGFCGSAAPGTCTLRAAIQVANETAAADLIGFAPALNGQTTTATTGDYPPVTQPLSIDASSLASGFTVDGATANSLFRFTGSVGTYAINNVAVINARGEASQGGGGIYFAPTAAATLTLTNVDITDSRAVADGGEAGGGLFIGSGHTVTISDGTISRNNTAGDTNPGGDLGGGIFNAGSLTITGTTIEDNTAAQGGGVFNSTGASLSYSGTVAVPASLRANTAAGLGGGGIYNFNGNLTLTDVIIGGNGGADGNLASDAAAVGGAGIYSELDTGGSTTLTRTTVKNNRVSNASSTGQGGGVYARKVVSAATFLIQDSTIDSNSTPNGEGGGLYVRRGRVEITGSTISSNTSGSAGGGIYLDKLATEAGGGRIALSNSTISGNSADVGAGIGVRADNTSLSSMVHTTVAENDATSAGGGISYGLPSDGALNPDLVFPGTFGNAFTSNVIAKNLPENCRTAFTHSDSSNSGYNVADDMTCGFINAPNDVQDALAAELGMLADNLGSTMTHGLLATHPAIDHANPLYVTATDQRGALPQDGDQDGMASRDAGAYEYGGYGAMHFDQSAYSVREDADSVTAVVKRYANPDVATSVLVSTADGTATEPADYVSLSSENVIFAATDLSEDVVVTIIDDVVFPEPGETFSLMLFAPNKGSDLGPRDAATVTIQDVEEGVFQFQATAVTVPEGGTAAVNENGTVGLTVTRTGGADGAVTVDFSVVGGGTTAVAGEDYVAASATGTLSWADGDSAAKTITIQLIDDIKDETGGDSSRTLQLVLSNPTGGARLGTPASTVNATVTLNDDDPTPVVALAVDPTSFSEDGGTATVTATLEGSVATSDATVTLALSGTASRNASCGGAADPGDYSCSGLTITIPAGQTTGNAVTLTGIRDTDVETPDETVVVDISVSGNVAEKNGGQQVTATIVDTVLVRGDLRFSPASYTGLEGTGAVALTVVRQNGDDGSASVQCAPQDGTAVAGADFTATPVTLTWADNEPGAKTCTIPLTNDTNRESNKHFTVLLTNPTGATIAPSDNEASVTLISDEQPRFQFNLDTTMVTEGTLNYLVTVEPLDVVVGEPVTVPFFTSDPPAGPGAATEGMDYTGNSGSFTWNNGESDPKTFTIAMIHDDGVVEGNETFNLNLDSPTGGGVIAGVNPTVVTIVDPPAVRFKAATFTSTDETDGSVIRVFVERIGNPQGAVSVEYSVGGGSGTATENTDYTAPPGTPMHVLSWANSDTADKFFDITIIGDSVDESNETIAVGLLNPSAGLTIGSPSTATAVITDDDTASYVIDDVTVTEGNSGTVTATFTVTRTASDQATSVDFTTASGTATEGTDFADATGTLNFAADTGSSTQTISVTVNGDTVDEADETYTVTLSGATGGAVIADGTGVGTITDDDTATINVADALVTEGTGAGTTTLDFLVTLSTASASSVTVDFATADGTAVQPGDYTSISVTVTFTPGDTTETVSVPVTRDAIDEADETLTANLSNASGAAIADATGTGTITDDENATYSIDDVTVTEGNAGTTTATFTVTRTASAESTSVDYDTDTITAVEGTDFADATGTLTFPPSDVSSTQTIAVAVTGDTVDESDETYGVFLSNPTGSSFIPVGNNQATGTIIDDDSASYTIDDVTVTEGNAGTTTATFTVMRTTSDHATTVDFTTAGVTATEGTDFADATGTLNFPANSSNSLAQNISVTVNGDVVDEADETYSVTLSNASAGTAIADGTGTGTITDDDTASYVIDDVTVTEGNSGTVTATFTVTRTASDQVTTVDFTTAGVTATEGTDFADATGTLNFPASATSSTQTIGVAINGDTVDESDETYTVALSNATGGVTIADATGTGTITDDDTASYVIDDVTVTEGNSGTVTATFTVTRTASDQVTTVDFTTAGVTATEGTDFADATGTLNFAAGATSSTQAISVLVNGDTVDEANETYEVNLSNASAGTIADATGLGTITDDDTAGVTVTQSGSSTAVTEGGATDTYSLVLTSQPTANVTITLNTGGQVSASPATITFTAANYSTAQTVTVTAVNDVAAEGAHSDTITHAVSSADASYNGISVASVSVTITDNDTAGVTVTQSGGSTAVTEDGATDTVTVQLTSQPSANVTITLSPDGQLAVNPATLTFTPANFGTPQTVTVRALDDGQVEGTHSGSLGGTSSSADPLYSGSLGTVTVAITDNDSVTAGDQAPAVVVTYSGGTVNVAPASEEGGGALSWSSVLSLLGLLGLRRRRALAAVLALAGLSPGAWAQELSYNNVDVRYLLVSVDDPSVDASGFALAGSWAVGKQVFLSASYAAVETDDFTTLGTTGSSKTGSTSLGVGGYRPLKPGLDLVGGASAVFAEAEGQGGFAGSADDTGYSLEAGLRGLYSPSVEWGAAVSYLAIFDDGATSFSAHALYHLSPQFSLAGGAGISDNSTQFNLGVRYSFGATARK